MPLDSPQLLSRLSPSAFSGRASEETRWPWISPCHTKKSPLQRNTLITLQRGARGGPEVDLIPPGLSDWLLRRDVLCDWSRRRAQRPPRGRAGAKAPEEPAFLKQIKVVAAESAGGASVTATHAVAGTPEVEPHVARR